MSAAVTSHKPQQLSNTQPPNAPPSTTPSHTTVAHPSNPHSQQHHHPTQQHYTVHAAGHHSIVRLPDPTPTPEPTPTPPLQHRHLPPPATASTPASATASAPDFVVSPLVYTPSPSASSSPSPSPFSLAPRSSRPSRLTAASVPAPQLTAPSSSNKRVSPTSSLASQPNLQAATSDGNDNADDSSQQLVVSPKRHKAQLESTQPPTVPTMSSPSSSSSQQPVFVAMSSQLTADSGRLASAAAISGSSVSAATMDLFSPSNSLRSQRLTRPKVYALFDAQQAHSELERQAQSLLEQDAHYDLLLRPDATEQLVGGGTGDRADGLQLPAQQVSKSGKEEKEREEEKEDESFAGPSSRRLMHTVGTPVVVAPRDRSQRIHPSILALLQRIARGPVDFPSEKLFVWRVKRLDELAALLSTHITSDDEKQHCGIPWDHLKRLSQWLMPLDQTHTTYFGGVRTLVRLFPRQGDRAFHQQWLEHIIKHDVPELLASLSFIRDEPWFNEERRIANHIRRLVDFHRDEPQLNIIESSTRALLRLPELVNNLHRWTVSPYYVRRHATALGEAFDRLSPILWPEFNKVKGDRCDS